MKKIVLAAVAAVGLTLGAGAAFAAGPASTSNGWYGTHGTQGYSNLQDNDFGASSAGGGG
ncbi:MAG TPA: hypothetical protein VN702_01510 [Acetobacteraceae bacterium]|nr:hypothetical protein [Acetobacteraceae bacterium]